MLMRLRAGVHARTCIKLPCGHTMQLRHIGMWSYEAASRRDYAFELVPVYTARGQWRNIRDNRW